MARVLVVTGDEEIGSLIADRLEASGHDVMCCPGPQAPRYVCRGGRGERCPLAAATDVVVLDGWLQSNAVRAGTPSWHLLTYYREHQVPVVYLVGPDGLPAAIRDANVRTLPRMCPSDDVDRAVHELAMISAGASSGEGWS